MNWYPLYMASPSASSSTSSGSSSGASFGGGGGSLCVEESSCCPGHLPHYRPLVPHPCVKSATVPFRTLFF
jgi:hypothetical protein